MSVEKKKRCTIPTAWDRPIFVTDNKGFPCAKGVLGPGSFTGSTTKQNPCDTAVFYTVQVYFLHGKHIFVICMNIYVATDMKCKFRLE